VLLICLVFCVVVFVCNVKAIVPKSVIDLAFTKCECKAMFSSSIRSKASVSTVFMKVKYNIINAK
jgi:hypothetical protein